MGRGFGLLVRIFQDGVMLASGLRQVFVGYSFELVMFVAVGCDAGYVGCRVVLWHDVMLVSGEANG